MNRCERTLGSNTETACKWRFMSQSDVSVICVKFKGSQYS